MNRDWFSAHLCVKLGGLYSLHYLFNIYINDLAIKFREALTLFILMYADDTALLV